MVSKFLPPCISSPSPSCPGVSLSQPTLHPPGLSLTYQASHTLPLRRLFLPPWNTFPPCPLGCLWLRPQDSSWRSPALWLLFSAWVNRPKLSPTLCLVMPLLLLLSCPVELCFLSLLLEYKLFGAECVYRWTSPGWRLGVPSCPIPRTLRSSPAFPPVCLVGTEKHLPGKDALAPRIRSALHWKRPLEGSAYLTIISSSPNCCPAQRQTSFLRHSWLVKVAQSCPTLFATLWTI